MIAATLLINYLMTDMAIGVTQFVIVANVTISMLLGPVALIV